MTTSALVLGPAEGDHLRAARLRAGRLQPYLAAALFVMQPVRSPGLGTVAVDRRWRLYVDPDAVMGWTVEQLAGALLHEVTHLVRDHAGMADRLGVTATLHRRWNAACDLAINDGLAADRIDLPEGGLQPEIFGLEPHATEQQYFEWLAERDLSAVVTPSGRDDGTGAGEPDHGSSADCGSGAHGQRRGWELQPEDDGGPAPGIGRAAAAGVRDRVRGAIADHPGTVPGAWRRWAEPPPAPPQPWRSILRTQLRARLHAAGAGETSWSAPDRRSDARPGVVMPGQRSAVVEVAVIVDTSASMDAETLGQALAETEAVVRATASREIWLLSVDTRIQDTKRVLRLGDVRLVGGGGTDMRPGIAHALTLRPAPDVIVVLTDGETPWPDRVPPGVALVVGYTGRPCPLPGVHNVRIGPGPAL